MLIIARSNIFLLSKEGVTQGDPLAMLLYGLAVLPLARELKSPDKWKQNWYADDSACLAQLLLIREWFVRLMVEGPKYGYFPKPEKSYIIVHPDFILQANDIFRDLGIKVVTGQRFLGGYIGTASDVECWLENKIASWVAAVEKLSNVAVHEPQAAFVALSKSVQNEWLFIQRVISDSHLAFTSLSDAIKIRFLPALFGSSLNDLEISLLCRPTRHLGIGILDPVLSANAQYSVSKIATSVLSQTILSGADLDINAHHASILKGINEKQLKDKEIREAS